MNSCLIMFASPLGTVFARATAALLKAHHGDDIGHRYNERQYQHRDEIEVHGNLISVQLDASALDRTCQQRSQVRMPRQCRVSRRGDRVWNLSERHRAEDWRVLCASPV